MARVMPLVDKLVQLFNGVPILLLRSPFHFLMSKGVVLLFVTGRKSGKTYAIPVNYIRDGDLVLATTDSGWWRNLRGGAPLTLRLQGRTYAGVGEAVTDEAARIEALAAMLRRFPGYGKWANVRVGRDGQPNHDDVVRAVRAGRVLIRIRLAESHALAGV